MLTVKINNAIKGRGSIHIFEPLTTFRAEGIQDILPVQYSFKLNPRQNCY